MRLFSGNNINNFLISIQDGCQIYPKWPPICKNCLTLKLFISGYYYSYQILCFQALGIHFLPFEGEKYNILIFRNPKWLTDYPKWSPKWKKWHNSKTIRLNSTVCYYGSAILNRGILVNFMKNTGGWAYFTMMRIMDWLSWLPWQRK